MRRRRTTTLVFWQVMRMWHCRTRIKDQKALGEEEFCAFIDEEEGPTTKINADMNLGNRFTRVS